MKLIEANDPGNKFAVPYMYGTILIGFNPAKVKAVLGDNAPVDSWDLIFKEENISKLSQCGVAMLDAPGDKIGQRANGAPVAVVENENFLHGVACETERHYT